MLDETDISYDYRNKNKAYRIKLRKLSDYTDNRELLLSIVKNSLSVT